MQARFSLKNVLKNCDDEIHENVRYTSQTVSEYDFLSVWNIFNSDSTSLCIGKSQMFCKIQIKSLKPFELEKYVLYFHRFHHLSSSGHPLN